MQHDDATDAPDTSEPPAAPISGPRSGRIRGLGPPARSAGPGALPPRHEDALRKAYARDDRRIHGATIAVVQALVNSGLARAIPDPRYERYVLSEKGERKASELTLALLTRHGQSTPPARTSNAATQEDAWRDRLVDFLVSPGDALVLTVDLPASERVGAGWRARIERCGPTKFMVHVAGPKPSTDS